MTELKIPYSTANLVYLTMHFDLDLEDEQITIKVASDFTRALSAPLVLGFSGEIGAGKTTFIRAMLRRLDIQGTIKSPTYTLVESYHTNDLHIHHFDLYRIQEETELEYIGFRDYFTTPAICCIEWPERAGSELSCIDIQLTFKIKGMGRSLHIDTLTPKGCQVLSLFAGAL